MESEDETKTKEPSTKAPTSSMTPVELNNLIVALRKTTRRAKVHTIRTMSRQIELYRKKKGTEKQVESFKKKSERLLEEMKVIKKLDIDWISKFSLYNTSNLQDVTNKRVETKSMVRVVMTKVLQAKVKEFRAAHSDWSELASYLISKTTGRRFKKRKFRPGKLKPAAHLDLKTAGSTVQSKTVPSTEDDPVEEKGSSNETETPVNDGDEPQSAKDEEPETETDNDKDADALRLERSKVIEDLEMGLESSDDESGGESDASEGSENDMDITEEQIGDSKQPNVEVKTPAKAESVILKKTLRSAKKPQPEVSSANAKLVKLKKTESPAKKPQKEVSSPKISKPTVKAAEPVNLSKGLMVIKKFSMDDTPAEQNATQEKDVSFLFEGAEPKRVTSGIKDSFFQGSDSEGSDNDHQNARDVSDVESDGEELERYNKQALDCTFTKSLTYNRRPRRDDNYRGRDSDWGQSRGRGHYERLESGRGRGGQRGRGNYSGEMGRGGGYFGGDSGRREFSRDRNAFSDRGRGGRGRGHHDSRGSFNRSNYSQDSNRTNWGKSDAPKESKKESSTKELHPSWQASLRKKQEQKIQISFTGKKTVFKDD